MPGEPPLDPPMKLIIQILKQSQVKFVPTL